MLTFIFMLLRPIIELFRKIEIVNFEIKGTTLVASYYIRYLYFFKTATKDGAVYNTISNWPYMIDETYKAVVMSYVHISLVSNKVLKIDRYLDACAFLEIYVAIGTLIASPAATESETLKGFLKKQIPLIHNVIKDNSYFMILSLVPAAILGNLTTSTEEVRVGRLDGKVYGIFDLGEGNNKGRLFILNADYDWVDKQGNIDKTGLPSVFFFMRTIKLLLEEAGEWVRK